ncbi:MAG TPA: hypothetical protein VLF67_00200 [Candidatus Saccharimonas sp.]|nr:hypothetical protein [Candidatus Saccharimonas sp.]
MTFDTELTATSLSNLPMLLESLAEPGRLLDIIVATSAGTFRFSITVRKLAADPQYPHIWRLVGDPLYGEGHDQVVFAAGHRLTRSADGSVQLIEPEATVTIMAHPE